MILEVKNISKYFSIERGMLKKEEGKFCALDDVSFLVNEFDTLGIVGESGSGKTTLAKIILGLIPATSGEIIINKEKINNFRKDIQIIFQNPYNSLNPKMRIIDTISEPIIIHKITEKKYVLDKVIDLLKIVGLEKDTLERYPAAFSGGQRQRICIARALATQPKLIILDEPLSSLDLTIQSKLLDLFMELKNKFNLTYIFISHNLAIIKRITNLIVVMQKGKIVETARTVELFSNPREEYTRNLLKAAA